MALPDEVKKPLEAVSNAVVERFRNPFAASFIISWVIFNWKPIVFLLLAKHQVEWSISYVEVFFTDIKHYLWFPLLSAVTYSVALPYIGVGIDMLLKHYLIYRNKSLLAKEVQAVKNKKAIILEQIELEEAEKDRRELKGHNKMVDDLQAKNKSLEEQLNSLQKESTDSYNALRDRAAESTRLYTTEREGLTKQVGELQMEVERLSSSGRQDAMNNKSQITKLTSEVSSIRREAENDKRALLTLSDMVQNQKSEISVTTLRFESGEEIVQVAAGDNVLYLKDGDELIHSEQVRAMMKKSKYTPIPHIS